MLSQKENIIFSPRAMECAVMVREIIQKDKSQHFSVSKLARKVGLNPRTLQDCFKHCYGKSIFVYGQRLRLESSKELLRNPDLTLQQIAEKSGYPEQANFGTAFKKKFGIGPGEWRKGIEKYSIRELPKNLPAANAFF